MKFVILLGLLCVGGAAAFYAQSGNLPFQSFFTPAELPETITPPNATFFGNEQPNPFTESETE